MKRDCIRITEAGILRAQFCDNKGQPYQASGVEVMLFEPGNVPGPDSPTLSGLTPTYLGNGTFQLSFTAVPPGGTWIDYWQGYVLGSLTTASLTFDVIASGVVVDYPTLGPCKNNLVEVTLASGIRSLDQVPLGEEEQIFFTTEYSPLYADDRKVRMEAGGILGSVPDFTLCMALLEASIEADILTFATPSNIPLYEHARREYVSCKAAQMVASNILANGGLLKNKKLADFEVEYDHSAMKDLLDDLFDKCKHWRKQLEAGGAARALRDPRGVIKGECDPDRPEIGRGWADVRYGERPFGNAKELPRGKRRWVKTYRRGSGRKGSKGGRGDW